MLEMDLFLSINFYLNLPVHLENTLYFVDYQFFCLETKEPKIQDLETRLKF